jgi:hypothetical protein
MSNDWFLSARTVRVSTPDGTLFVHIAEDEKGKLKQIMLNLGKAGTAASAWANSLAASLTMSIELGATLEDLLELLSNITSGSSPRLAIGGNCTSGPEGVWMALMRYRREKHEEIRKGLKVNDRTLSER